MIFDDVHQYSSEFSGCRPMFAGNLDFTLKFTMIHPNSSSFSQIHGVPIPPAARIERGGVYIPKISRKKKFPKITQNSYFCYSKDARRSGAKKWGRNVSVEKSSFFILKTSFLSSRSCQNTLGTILNKCGELGFRKCSLIFVGFFGGSPDLLRKSRFS